jgi:hypothetical protein
MSGEDLKCKWLVGEYTSVCFLDNKAMPAYTDVLGLMRTRSGKEGGLEV